MNTRQISSIREAGHVPPEILGGLVDVVLSAATVLDVWNTEDCDASMDLVEAMEGLENVWAALENA